MELQLAVLQAELAAMSAPSSPVPITPAFTMIIECRQREVWMIIVILIAPSGVADPESRALTFF